MADPVARLTQALTRLDLSQPTPLGRSAVATVWAVLRPDGSRAVLKLFHRADRGNEASGTAYLQAMSRRGAVCILQDDADIVVMEHLAGPSLGDIARHGDEPGAARLLAEAASRLHQPPIPQIPGLMPLTSVLSPLLLFDPDTAARGSLRWNICRARDLALHLLDTGTGAVPLHGDLHHDNIILTHEGPRVIDAKGYAGDPAFELSNALRHPRDMADLVRDPRQFRRRIDLFSDALSVDPHRLSNWAAAKCALSILWRSDGPPEQDTEQDLLSMFLESGVQ
ncbi:MAG: aminoglycoside phosphotransferase family protein [Pseudomonadota bacterium]